MLRKIRLYGVLAKFIGKRVLEADVASAAEAVRFLVANFPEVEAHMIEQHYRVSLGSYDLAEAELHDPAGQQDIKIVPVLAGAGAVGRIIAGIALVALAFIPGIGWAAAAAATATTAATAAGFTLAGTLLFGVGTSLILGGIGQLLTPMPKMNKDDNDPRKSYSFSGIQNTGRQGVPVPIVYGETVVGSVVIAAGVDTEQVRV